MIRRLIILALAFPATAGANVWLADAPPPDRAPPSIAAPPPAPSPLGDRWTMTAQVGVGWLTIDGVANEAGVAINPTLARTFDRIEVAADYLAMDWSDDEGGMRSAGMLHRIGGDVRYQVGRVRIDRMTMDAVATAGLGWQHIVRDHGAPIDRPDLSAGVLLRVITDVDDRDRDRVFFGFELGARMIIAPDGDRGVVIAFGVPLGW